MRISDWSSDVCSSDLRLCAFSIVAPSKPATGDDTTTVAEAGAASATSAGGAMASGSGGVRAFGSCAVATAASTPSALRGFGGACGLGNGRGGFTSAGAALSETGGSATGDAGGGHNCAAMDQVGSAHVVTPVTKAQLV